MNLKIAKHQAVICSALVREIDKAVVERHEPADQILSHIYRQHPEYGSRDRNFYSNAVFSWFRWRGWLKSPANANIALAILLDASEIPPQMEYMLEDSNLSQPGLKPAGSLAIEDKADYLRRLLNISGLRIEQLVPEWFPDFLFIPNEDDRQNHSKKCITSFQTRPPTWLRLPLGGEDGALSRLGKAGYEIERHPLLKQAVFVKGPKKFDATQFPAIAVQDLTSQCAGLCCNPKAEESWWDMCAGSGGKSLHLAGLMHDHGSILATDVRPAILNQSSKRLKKNRSCSIKPLLWDGKIDPLPGKYFDGVLVDAPCSGIGTWHRNPDARWRTEPKQINHYAEIQQNLLETAAPKIKSGGRLVYSTCTLTKMENTDIISRFLELRHEFRLEKLINPLSREPANGIIWIWPWEGNCMACQANGMFVAVMKKQ